MIGAGAAGLLAAARAAECQQRTLLLEKNRKPGVKILMSGGTRCNITHATDARGIVEAFGEQGPFLHSALAALSPADLIELIETEGVPTKVEPTGKIFPASDTAVDVLQAFLSRLERSGATMSLSEPVLELHSDDSGFVIRTSYRMLQTRRVILASGGRSYPGAGTTGDGYAWAAALGHRIIPPRPALTPITTDAHWVHELKGVTIIDTHVQVIRPAEEPSGGRVPRLAQRRGSFLFTHFGLSGPAVLDVSRAVTAEQDPRTLALECDFLPDESMEALEQWLLQEAQGTGKRQLGSTLVQKLPRRLGETLAAQAGLSPETRLAELPRPQRRALLGLMKQLRIPISGTRGFKKAEVTAGGVARDEVDSRTMQSKLVPGLFFCGEVLDLDGPIGGYNFQAAWSTGWLAGTKASESR